MSYDYVWDVAALFDRVPAVIWSGVIGAIIAAGISYIGIRSANRGSLERLHLQHLQDEKASNIQRTHDALQKAEDRKAAIRREVYIQAIEEAHTLIGHLGRLPDLPVMLAGHDERLQSFLKANAKIWLVAESEAAHLSRDLATHFSEALVSISVASNQYRVDMESVRYLEKQVEKSEEEADRLRRRLNEAKEAGASQDVIGRLGDLLVEANDFTKSLKRSQQAERLRLLPRRVVLLQETMEIISPVQELLVKMVSFLRAELDLPSDLGRFQEQHAEMERRARAIFVDGPHRKSVRDQDVAC